MSALCSLCLAALVALAAGDNRLWPARVELIGPLEEVRLDLGEAGTSVLAAGLLAGERRTLALPLPARTSPRLGPPESAPRPTLSATGAGEARFLGWKDADPGAFLARIPAGLRARPRPPLADERPRPAPAALALLCAAFALGFAWRRSAARACAVALAAAGLVVGLPLASAPAEGVVVLEGDRAAPRWLSVEGARERLSLARELLEGEARLEVEPAGRALFLSADGVTARWRVEARGAALYLIRPLAPIAGLERARNDHASLERAWVRGGDGVWRGGGAWPLGAPFDATAGGGDPPGWLAAGLPQGVDVLVARIDERTWLRVSGF